MPRKAVYTAASVTEVTARSLASLSLPRGVDGSPLPLAGTFDTVGGRTYIWTGVDQWLVEDASGEPADRDLRERFPCAAVTDQTDGWVSLDIHATDKETMTRILEKLVNIDLSRFGPGSALRTGMHHMSVMVIRRSTTVVTLMGMRSAAGSVWKAVTEAVERAA